MFQNIYRMFFGTHCITGQWVQLSQSGDRNDEKIKRQECVLQNFYQNYFIGFHSATALLYLENIYASDQK